MQAIFFQKNINFLKYLKNIFKTRYLKKSILYLSTYILHTSFYIPNYLEKYKNLSEYLDRFKYKTLPQPVKSVLYQLRN